MNDNQAVFSVGDVVYLKCGSCAMVVENVQVTETRTLYHCVWQNYETKLILRDSFEADVLRKKY